MFGHFHALERDIYLPTDVMPCYNSIWVGPNAREIKSDLPSFNLEPDGQSIMSLYFFIYCGS